jgi:hypothetical protein
LPRNSPTLPSVPVIPTHPELVAEGSIDFHGHLSSCYILVGWLHSKYNLNDITREVSIFSNSTEVVGELLTVPFVREDVASFGAGIIFLVQPRSPVIGDIRGVAIRFNSDRRLFLKMDARAEQRTAEQILQHLTPVLAGRVNLPDILLPASPTYLAATNDGNLKLPVNTNVRTAIPLFSDLSEQTEFLTQLIEDNSPIINRKWLAHLLGLRSEFFKNSSEFARAIISSSNISNFVLNPLFDADWCQRQTVNVKFSNYFDCLMHYLSAGEAAGLSPNPFFPVSVYVTRTPKLAARLASHKGSYLEHFIQFESFDAAARTLHFDESAYNPLPTNQINSPSDLGISAFSHYVAFGWKEGVSPNPLFDEQWYVDHYDDVAHQIRSKAYPNGFSHYLFVGEAEKSMPSPFFDPDLYLDLNDDVKGAIKAGQVKSAFSHYWQNGSREGRRVDLTGLAAFVSSHFRERFPSSSRRVTNNQDLETTIADRVSSKRSQILEFKRGNVKPLVEASQSFLASGDKIPKSYRDLTKTWFAEEAKPIIRILEFEQPTIYQNEVYSLYLSGFAFVPFGSLVNVHVEIDGKFVPCRFFKTVRTDFAKSHTNSMLFGGTIQTGFFCEIDFRSHGFALGHHEMYLSFVFLISSKEKEFVADSIRIVINEKPAQTDVKATTQVCMATYNPPEKPFDHQVQTILDQKGTKPALLISDDHSSLNARMGMYKTLMRSEAITFSSIEQNLGFIGNFERSLRLRSQHAKYILFADQDDSWYDNKISQLKKKLTSSGAICVFSDMRIVKNDGTVIAESFWGKRRLHFHGPIALAIANTVTGAASIFTSELADKLTPFPRFLQIYHDQWLAVIAAALGTVDYVAKPLYDYIQHGSNVLGFSGSRGGETLKWRTIARRIAILRHRPASNWDDRDCDYYVLAAEQIRGALLQRYVLLTEALRRIPVWSNVTHQVAAIAFCELVSTSQSSSTIGLMSYWRQLRRVVRGDAAFIGIDYLLKSALGAQVIALEQGSGVASRVYKRLTSSASSVYLNQKIWGDEKQSDFAKKIRPIDFRSILGSGRVAHLFLPELRFATFFGGYYSKISLVKQLIAAGFAVRLILIDQPIVDYEEILRISDAYPDLAEALACAECIAIGNRDITLDFAKNDLFLATTWWSAKILEQIRSGLDIKKFFYFIQEYEPFTFPMGTWYRAAEETYHFPHIPIFSTKMLADYFQSIGAGIFNSPFPPEENSYLIFNNPIVGLGNLKQDHSPGKKKRLLFYARPQAHAARNMYDFGLAALRMAAERLKEGADGWEFIGIGAGSASKVNLAGGIDLQLIDKLDFDGYREILGSSRVGLVLMYTPHPSLVPLEMASAGLYTITNSCFSKTSKSFAEISDNIIVAEPTVQSIADALADAITKVNDGRNSDVDSKLVWPTNPEEAFPKVWIDQLILLQETIYPGNS